jgi:enoyl-CoA hydratase
VSDHPNVRLERDGAVAVVTIDKPPVNAMSFADYDDLRRVFHVISDDPDIRSVVFTGAGERAFCAGHDVKDFVSLDHEGATDGLARVRITFNAVYDCPKPVIAAVNGPALGTGLALASLADIRLASPNAFFALPEIDRGVLGGSKHAMRLLPQGLTRLMVFTGRRISAEHALRVGMIEEIHPPGELIDAAMGLAHEIAGKSPTAIHLAKQGLNRIETMGLKEAYEYECTLTAEVRRTPEAGANARAFLEGRGPQPETL